MQITLRRATPADAETCADVCYRAFCAISDRHNFPHDFPSVDVARGLMDWMLSMPQMCYGVVAERDGRVIGSNFLWEGSAIAGVGPITIDPAAQDASAGRALMDVVLQRARERNAPGVRLVQSAYHGRSMALYTKLGFVIREPLANLQGPALNVPIPGREVRRATDADSSACAALCADVHGHDRTAELAGAVANGTATVVVHDGHITGYATQLGFFGHAVARTNDDLKALIGAAAKFDGPGILLPTRNTEVFRWCLERGLRIVQPFTLMSMGLYNQPAGAFLPSILY
ncbi:MAG: GNAT family N-acetyltransferase [Tepidisphaeraceae bacterium]